MYKELSVGSQELTMLKIMISLGLFDSYMTVNFFFDTISSQISLDIKLFCFLCI